MNSQQVIARRRAERTARIATAKRFAGQLEPTLGVQAVVVFVAWTPTEWQHERARSNPIAVEALHDGVWLVGSPDTLAPPVS
jgi:hypothetical protein